MRTLTPLAALKRGDVIEVTQRGILKRLTVSHRIGTEIHNDDDGCLVIDPGWDEIWVVTE